MRRNGGKFRAQSMEKIFGPELKPPFCSPNRYRMRDRLQVACNNFYEDPDFVRRRERWLSHNKSMEIYLQEVATAIHDRLTSDAKRRINEGCWCKAVGF